MDHPAEAEANYKRAIALRADYWDAPAIRRLGNFYDRQNRPKDAIAQYQRVIELTPDNPAVYSNLGAENIGMDDAAAEAALKKSIQLAPNYECVFESRLAVPRRESAGAIINEALKQGLGAE